MGLGEMLKTQLGLLWKFLGFFQPPVLRFLHHALAPDGAAWVAEPGRSVYETFLHALQSGGWQGRRVYGQKVEALYAQPVPVTVQVWEIRRG